jgi:thymidylate synthase
VYRFGDSGKCFHHNTTVVPAMWLWTCLMVSGAYGSRGSVTPDSNIALFMVVIVYIIHPPLEMHEYLRLVAHVLHRGEERVTRNGTTLSVFGVQCVYDCSESFPLVTTKHVSYRNVLNELLWFFQAGTTTDGVGSGIWDANATRDFYDSRGLTHSKEGELGPLYGCQWRHAGSAYPDKKGGVDQLQQCIDLIRHDPTSRRIVFTAWNPTDVPRMALPPCHIWGQFYCRREYLDLQFYQRSGDVGLGVPYNIASYAFLLYMVAHVTGKRPGKLPHVLGDAHPSCSKNRSYMRAEISRVQKSPVYNTTRCSEGYLSSCAFITRQPFTLNSRHWGSS